jgi:hypothetical protein
MILGLKATAAVLVVMRMIQGLVAHPQESMQSDGIINL